MVRAPAMFLLRCAESSSFGTGDDTLPLQAPSFDLTPIALPLPAQGLWSNHTIASGLPTATSLYTIQACSGQCSSWASHAHTSSTLRGSGLGWCLKIQRLYITFIADNHQSRLHTPHLWGSQCLTLRIFKLEGKGKKCSCFSLTFPIRWMQFSWGGQRDLSYFEREVLSKSEERTLPINCKWCWQERVGDRE